MKIIIITNLKESSYPISGELLIIPHPQITTLGNKAFKITKSTGILYDNVENNVFFQNMINEELSFFKAPQISDINEKPLEDIEFPEFNIDKQADEGYSLKIENNMVKLIAESEKGIFYGIQTLLQLMKFNQNETIFPEITIVDFPNFKIRAVADDISRGAVPTVENIKKFIRILSHFKMNFFIFGYECDIFYYEKHPTIGIGRDPLTREEILEIQDYAKKYFMEIVPLVCLTGHVDNVLLVPGYRDLGEFPGAQTFDISNEKVRIFIKDCLDELCSNFSSNYFHITLDELFDFGRYKSKKYLEQKGKETALLEFYNWMFDILRKHGKDKIIMYHDTVIKYDKVRKGLSKDIIIFFWEYFLHFNFRLIKKLQRAGFSVIVSPTVFSWSRNFPDIKKSIKNIVALTRYGYKRGENVLGTGVSSWGDFGNESFRDHRLFGFTLSADVSWNTPEFNLERFQRAYNKEFFGITDERMIEIFDSLGWVNRVITGTISRMLAVPIFYQLFWRHPFPSKKPKINTSKMKKLLNKMEITQKKIEAIEPLIKKNKDYVKYLKFSAKIAMFYAKKNLYSDQISKLLENTPISAENKKEAISLISKLREDFKNIKGTYMDLWLRCAKPDGLKRLLPYYDWLDYLYIKKLEEIENNINWTNPFLESEWIGCPEKNLHQDYRYFRKTFTLSNQKVKKAFLQGISNHYMKVSINGSELGEVFSRFSLTVKPIDERVKVFDITEHLKEKNVITVEAANFVDDINAINIYAEIYFENNEMQIIKSDENWKTNKAEIINWKELGFNDSLWERAKSYGVPPEFNGEITRPYFLDNFPSKTTYMFGTRGYFKNFIPQMLLPLLGKYLKSIGA
ncbi:MAG: glycoside hydrolase family 20 zincin-like fold domain-containing protein [Promethearchaeota archaeon]